MQTSRIRYVNLGEQSFINKTPLILNGDLLKVQLTGLEWFVSGSNGIRLDSGSAKNNADLKKSVKESLKKLGVNFLDEIRTKKV